MKSKLAGIVLTLMVTACDKDTPMAPVQQPPANAAAVVRVLADAYRARDNATYSALLSDDFRMIRNDSRSHSLQWNAGTERILHSRMFNPHLIPASDPPLIEDHWLRLVSITLTPATSFRERFDLYTTATPPGSLDPVRWKAEHATYSTDVFFQLAGDTDFQVRGSAEFTVITDLTKNAGDPGKCLLYRWEEWGQVSAAGVEVISWFDFKSLYMTPGPQPPANPADVVQLLKDAYQARDYAAFSRLLAADFVFFLDEPNPDTGETRWDVTTERRIHARMFEPENIPPSEPPLRPDHWLQSVSVTLTPREAFAERPDLYTTFDPPGLLDPTRWRAASATYSTHVLFDLWGPTSFLASGRAHFTVITDLTKVTGDPSKFLIYRWEDLGAWQALSREQASWTGVKGLYR